MANSNGIDTGTIVLVGILAMFAFLGWSITTTAKAVLSWPLRMFNALVQAPIRWGSGIANTIGGAFNALTP